MGDEPKPPPPMPIMSGNQRRIPDYQKEILEGGQRKPEMRENGMRQTISKI